MFGKYPKPGLAGTATAGTEGTDTSSRSSSTGSVSRSPGKMTKLSVAERQYINSLVQINEYNISNVLNKKQV